MNKKALIYFSSILLLAPFMRAEAYNQADQLFITGSAGRLFFDSHREIKNSTTPNMAIGYNFTDKFGVEAQAGVFHNDATAGTTPTATGSFYDLNGLYYFNPWNQLRLQPYFLGGIGVTKIKPAGISTSFTPNGDEAVYQMHLHAGLGAEWFVTSRFAVRGEARYIFTPIASKNEALLNIGLTLLLGPLPYHHSK